jgi:hypothetical protein
MDFIPPTGRPFSFSTSLCLSTIGRRSTRAIWSRLDSLYVRMAQWRDRSWRRRSPPTRRSPRRCSYAFCVCVPVVVLFMLLCVLRLFCSIAVAIQAAATAVVEPTPPKPKVTTDTESILAAHTINRPKILNVKRSNGSIDRRKSPPSSRRRRITPLYPMPMKTVRPNLDLLLLLRLNSINSRVFCLVQ